MQGFFIDFIKYFPQREFMSQQERYLSEENAAENIDNDMLLYKQR